MSLEIPLVLLAWAGHIALWVFLVNRVHGTGLPRSLVTAISGLFHCVQLCVPAAVIWMYAAGIPRVPDGSLSAAESALRLAYPALCWVVAAVFLPAWLGSRFVRRVDPVLISNHTSVVDFARLFRRLPVAGLEAAVLSRVPGNQILQLHIHEKVLRMPGLPAALDGVSIAHLSDLHFTGQLNREFFEQVIDRTNALGADLVAVTGDLFDDLAYLDWIDATLGRLSAPQGVYFVLGNHDVRLRRVDRIRRHLCDAGLIDLGGRWIERTVSGERILLAGNERPWMGSLPPMQSAPPPSRMGGPFRLLLSHGPDQYAWARRENFDLMLAGHTHGGQIRLPLIGPVFSSSATGLRYVDGVFYEPPTVLHVSRGISAATPIRLNCPPELAKLTLRRH